MKNGEYEVYIVPFPKGCFQGCKVCMGELSNGNFAIGLHLCDGGKEFKYVIGATPQMCCGEEKRTILLFQTVEDADVEAKKVIHHLNEKGTTEGLRLLGFYVNHN
jgi:hypothetical protein